MVSKKSTPEPIDDRVAERLAKLENAVGPLMHRVTDLQAAFDLLTSSFNHHKQQGDLNIQMHCDTALALRQVSGALEDLIRRGTK